MTKYRVVNTNSLAGLKKAERLHALGWRAYRVGLFHTWFYKRSAI